MQLLDSRPGYGLVSRALHWSIVFGIFFQWALSEGDVMPLHYSIGMLLLGLAVIRVVWRLFSRQPDWPVDMKPYEITIARVVHIAFYALLFAIPLSGWAVASVEDEPLRIFNRFEIPRLVLGGEDTLEEVHETLFNILVGLAVLHVIGAARHWLAARRLQSARR